MNTAQKIRGNPFWFLRVEHCNYPNSRQRRKTRIKIFLFLPFVKFDNKKKLKSFWQSFHFFFSNTLCARLLYTIYTERESIHRELHEYLFRGHDDIGWPFAIMGLHRHDGSPPKPTNQANHHRTEHTHTHSKSCFAFFFPFGSLHKNGDEISSSLCCVCVYYFLPHFEEC